jgi:beta-phosphoglucomutase-like phosphatase (HAD superfamily)
LSRRRGAQGHGVAVVSSSTNAREVLAAAGIGGLFEQVVDANLGEQEDLRGKPAPDFFLECARQLAIAPAEGAVFEDAVAGVEALIGIISRPRRMWSERRGCLGSAAQPPWQSARRRASR